MKPLVLALALCCFVPEPGLAAVARISLDVRNVEIGDAIAMLAIESGRNVVADGSVKPERITLHLHDVTFEQALAAIVDAHGLHVRTAGGILIVAGEQTPGRTGGTALLPLLHADADDVSKELMAALPAGTVVVPDKRTASILVEGDAQTLAAGRELVERLDREGGQPASEHTVAYRLRYLKADVAVAKLKAIWAEGSVQPDMAQNAVLVTGGARLQEAAKGFLAIVDVAGPQVMFEVKVADVTPVNDASNVGIEFGGLDLSGQAIAGSAAYAFTGGTIPVYVRLNALVSNGRASILATPRLVTVNNTEATLSIGQTYPIVYSTSVFGGQNVQYVDIGVHLRITPTIGADGSVTAELHPEYSELLGYTPTGYPIVANRKIDSTLRVRDNETIVLGGLFRETSNETITKIPGLADIPIIGGFFKNKQKNHERDEIVFLITPHVIYPGAQPPVK